MELMWFAAQQNDYWSEGGGEGVGKKQKKMKTWWERDANYELFIGMENNWNVDDINQEEELY